ncbi:MAG: tetratricopeptide repeat protein [Oscillospiraceae bacterium]
MPRGQEYNTYDRINICDLCNEIATFSRGHSSKKNLIAYSSRNAILKSILPNTNEWRTEITLINKLSSGNGSIKALKMIPPNIEQNDFRKSVMKECLSLENAIRNTYERGSVNMNGSELLEFLMRSCNSMFFSKSELDEIKLCYANEASTSKKNFIGLLFLHALSNIAINLPHFASERIFREALTLSSHTSMRTKLLKCAADSGHGYAALMYANYVYDDDPDTALEYFLIASGFKPSDDHVINGRPAKCETESNALWEIAYMFENHKLNESKINYVDNIIAIDKRISSAVDNRLKLDDDEVIGQRIDNNNDLHLRDYILGFSFEEHEVNQVIQYTKDKCVIYALKLYLYIAKKDLSFPKAFNSLGKVILGDYIGRIEKVPHKDIDKIRFALAKNYLDTAIHFGNTNAMVNLAIFYHNRLKLGKELTDSELHEMRYYLETAAAFDEREAQHHLGEILMSEGNYEKAQEYLQYAADREFSTACHSLGKVHAFNLRDDEAIKCFEKALSLKCHDAAYDLAELYLLRLSAKAGEPMATTYRQYAISMLHQRMPYMSDACRKKSMELLSRLEIKSDITV